MTTMLYTMPPSTCPCFHLPSTYPCFPHLPLLPTATHREAEGRHPRSPLPPIAPRSPRRIVKLMAMLEMVTSIGAHAAPALLGDTSTSDGVAVIGMQSWYHPHFLGERLGSDLSMAKMMDSAVRWPQCLSHPSAGPDRQRSDFFADLNRCTIFDVVAAKIRAPPEPRGGAGPRGGACGGSWGGPRAGGAGSTHTQLASPLASPAAVAHNFADEQGQDERRLRGRHPPQEDDDEEGSEGEGRATHGLRGWPIVTYSHFLPHPSLHRGYTMLEHIEGSFALREQLGQMHTAAGTAAAPGNGASPPPHVHVFGHTHFSIDRIIDGVRYVQHPLGNPHERRNGWQIQTSESRPFAKVWSNPNPCRTHSGASAAISRTKRGGGGAQQLPQQDDDLFCNLF